MGEVPMTPRTFPRIPGGAVHQPYDIVRNAIATGPRKILEPLGRLLNQTPFLRWTGIMGFVIFSLIVADLQEILIIIVRNTAGALE